MDFFQKRALDWEVRMDAGRQHYIWDFQSPSRVTREGVEWLILLPASAESCSKRFRLIAKCAQLSKGRKKHPVVEAADKSRKPRELRVFITEFCSLFKASRFGWWKRFVCRVGRHAFEHCMEGEEREKKKVAIKYHVTEPALWFSSAHNNVFTYIPESSFLHRHGHTTAEKMKK